MLEAKGIASEVRYEGMIGDYPLFGSSRKPILSEHKNWNRRCGKIKPSPKIKAVLGVVPSAENRSRQIMLVMWGQSGRIDAINSLACLSAV